MTHGISLLILIFILLGLHQRRVKKNHILLMLTAFTLDVLLLLYVEVTREAIGTALKVPPPFVLFHIGVSVMTLIFYGIQIKTGIKMYKTGVLSPFHKRGAILFLVFRLSNFLTGIKVGDFL